jgi:hypothetical protein
MELLCSTGVNVGAPTQTNFPIPDSGASAHFFPLRDDSPVHSVVQLDTPLPITTLDGAVMHIRALIEHTIIYCPETPPSVMAIYNVMRYNKYAVAIRQRHVL